MADFPRSKAVVLPLHVSSLGRYGLGLMSRGAGVSASPASATWVSNLIAYVPVAIPYAYPVNRVWWVNGSTITTTNVDFGIYTSGGAKLFSTGSTAAVGSSAVQYVTPSTPFVLAADRYYFAWTCDNTTSRAYVTSLTAAANGRLMGLLQEAGSGGLPTSMTPASWALTVGAPFCGITRTSSGF